MSYKDKYELFLASLTTQGIDLDEYIEFKFESLSDWSLFGSAQDLVDWYYDFVNSTTMKIEHIPLEECGSWSYETSSGSIIHDSKEFFKVEGVRVSGTASREVDIGWDQPFLTQIGNDGGILGLIRKRFKGIPHYLIEAKEEPGNFNIVQISTTVQATFSNLKRAHKGGSTNYSDCFLNTEDYPAKVLIDQWTSEDGGRLFNKRNRSMLIEFDENSDLPLVSERFRWVSLYQLKALTRTENAIVAPHIRGIISMV